MQWFGDDPPPAFVDPESHTSVPIGELCVWCDEAVTAQDSGVMIDCIGESCVRRRAQHYECHLRQVIGGVNHLRKLCTCCGGSLPPDPSGMSRRNAAQLAVDEWERRR